MSESRLAEPPVSRESGFAAGDESASSTVGYRATTADQKAVFELWSQPKTPQCLASSLAAAYRAEYGTGEQPAVTPITSGPVGQPVPPFGDRSIAYQIMFPQSSTRTVVLAIKGRAEVWMSFTSYPNPYPQESIEHYTRLVIGRLTRT